MEIDILHSNRLRNFVFGVEDSLVSTVGLVSGIAAVGSTHSVILLTGTVLIFVEAFSMSVGALLSENSAHEYRAGEEVPLKNSIGSAAIMFVSYFFSGFIVLFPYLIWPITTAFYISIALSLISLFILGAISARFSGTPLVKKGIVMALVGGIAILLGVLVGSLVQNIK